MIEALENRTGKTIYGMLQIIVIIFTLYGFKPDSPDMRDDFRTSGMLFVMALLSFPISIIAAPLAFGLSLIITGIICLVIGQFTDIRNISPFSEILFVLLAWLGMFGCGYLQWFWFPSWSKNRRSIIEKSHI